MLMASRNVTLEVGMWQAEGAVKVVRNLSFIDSIVSIMWIALTLLMVIVLALVYRRNGNGHRRNLALGAIIALIIATWTYSYYADLGSGILKRVLYANYFYMSLWVAVFVAVAIFAWQYALLLLPTIIWVILATIYVIGKLRVKAAGIDLSTIL